jgi:hypothetical protein
MTAFDGSPVRSDYALLSQWWNAGDGDGGYRALLYNTITLHDGNRVPGLVQGGPSRTSPATLEALLRALPATEWVAENAGTVLFRQGGRDYLRAPGGTWNEYGGTPQ